MRLRHRRDFDAVERFVVFAGYPRSGHSLVGAMLNAHRDAVVAHELDIARLLLGGCGRDRLYAEILARAFRFDREGNRSNYDYQVPGQWQGRFDRLRVVGDKRGGAFTRALAGHPDLLPRLRRVAGVPLRVLHVVRDPLDNIAAIAIWNRLSLDDAIDFYFAHCRTTAGLPASCAGDELATVHHEDMVREPRAVLARLLAWLGLAPAADHLDACAGIVFPRPTRTRGKLAWSAAQLSRVERAARAYAFLDRYRVAAP
jgi:hypothetical protein